MTVTDSMYQVEHLPSAVTHVKKEVVKSFSHSKRVGGYLLGRTLGVGSFAKVKEGLHLTTGEKVAVKVIDKKRAKTDNYVRKNLRREGRLLQMVRHPNVVALYEVMETDNSYYLVTELCRGGDLMDYITSKKRLQESEVTKYIGQIVSAVDYLHRLGIIHRDLKIENLLLDANKDIKLIDFGLSNFIKTASSADGVSSQEFCNTQCGSPAYAAPELLNHEKYGLQVDLWSIGVNMYAMLTGGLPFTVEPFNIKALYAKMKDRQMNPVPDDLTRECKDLLRKFLTPDPARRVTIAEAFGHPWLSQGNKTFSRHPCPNKMKTSDLEADILSHMSENLGFRMGEVIKFVTCNTPSPACATYHLYLERLNRHLAELRATGQVPAPVHSPSRVTLHLQEMQTKPQKQPSPQSQPQQPHGSSPIAATPTAATHTPRLHSRGVASEATDATDATATTDESERKENKNPMFKTDVISESSRSPTQSSATSRPESKISQNSSALPLRHFQKRLLQEPLTKGNTSMGVPNNSNNRSDDCSEVKKSLSVDKYARIGKTHSERLDSIRDARDRDLMLARVENLARENSPPVGLTPREKTRRTRGDPPLFVVDRNSEKIYAGISDSSQGKTSRTYRIHTRPKENASNKDSGCNSSSGSTRTDSGKNKNNNNTVTPRLNYYTQQQNKLLVRRGMVKSMDGTVISVKQTPVVDKALTFRNNNNNNNISNNNNNNSSNNSSGKHTSGNHPVPTAASGQPISKQYVPFRSAQDRPNTRLSENFLNSSSLKPREKAKLCTESLSLHGKNMLVVPDNEDANLPSKRPVSPQRPVVIRRRLAKRHRVGDITSSVTHVIQDVDQSVTTELLAFEITEQGVGANPKAPLPSISPTHTPR